VGQHLIHARLNLIFIEATRGIGKDGRKGRGGEVREGRTSENLIPITYFSQGLTKDSTVILKYD
jgi:hypothetical protein